MKMVEWQNFGIIKRKEFEEWISEINEIETAS